MEDGGIKYGCNVEKIVGVKTAIPLHFPITQQTGTKTERESVDKVGRAEAD